MNTTREMMGVLLAAALALASNAALAGGTVFENWSEETATVTSAVRVATYNIRQSNCDRDTPNAWEERKADLVALIRKLDLDVFGLQEVNPDQAAYLRETLSEFTFTGDHRNKDRVSGEASPVLYRKDRFEALGGGTFWLSETPDVPGSKGWDAANPRICSWLRLRDRGTGGVFCFANVHTDNKGETARREGLSLVLRRMSESNPPETPVVLVGDFNCRENEEPILAVAEKMTNALYASETPPSGPWRTGNGWHWNDRERLITEALALDAGTRNAKIKYTGRFDYIFVSRGVRVESFETVGTPRHGMQTYPSDHFPVVADLAVLAARLRPPSAAVVFENWSEKTAVVNIAEDGRKGWIKALPANGEKKGRFLGMLGCKLSDLSKAKVGFLDGRLVVDTTECDLSQPKAFICVQFAMPLADLPRDGKVDFTAEMKATPGAHWLIGHNGPFSEEAAPFDKLRQRKKTSYWNNRPVIAEDGNVHPYVYSHAIPAGLKHLDFDIRLESPGVYEFGRISWDVSKTAAVPVDSKRNLVVNGGAERGWYGTAMASTTCYSETGRFLGQDGHWFTTSTEPAIDTAEKHSGRASFRFHIDHDRDSIPAWGPYNMEFCAVPVVPGKPLVFTCWAKADRNGRRMNLRLAVESEGGSYNANLKLTTEWKRYRLLVKSVGEKQKGCYGNLGAYSSYGLYVPRLDFVSPGTFWVDDCGVFQAEDGDYEIEPICASGKINKDSAVYYTGERISAKLKIECGADDAGREPTRVKVSSKAINYRGETVATTAERTVSLKDGAAEFAEELKLPAAFRGPVQWLFTVKAGDVSQHVGFGLGVIDVRKPLLKRFGYNLYRDANIPRVLETFRDFRIGSVRIWDDAIRTERHIEEMRRFNEAGVDVLYCFANAGVLPQSRCHLVVKDPTEWQDHIAYVVTNVLGKVCAYEILNEPNARSGLGKNPDPEKYLDIDTESNTWCIKVASEAIRRYDKKALIVGPTTCKTDLGWTLEVLRRGAAEYLDVISEHPYFAMPEVQGYAKKVETLIREGSGMKGRHMPSWATERGKTTPSNPENACMYPNDTKGAARNVSTMIVSFAGGSERFFDFRLGSFNSMFQYMSLHNGNPDNGCLARPSCLLYAQRALMDLIEDAPCVKELNAGVASRAYVFDRGDRRVVAIWKFTGEPRTVKLPHPALVYDFMGTPSRREELVLDIFPQYMVTKAPVDKIEGVFAKLDFGADAAAVEEKREQLKVPFFEKNVDWSKAAVVAGKKADAGTRNSTKKFINEPKPGDALEVRLAWNRSGLMMRAIVEKDGFHPGGENVMNLWKGDGLQIAFDTMKNAQKIATGYDDEDFEYDLAMFNGKPTVFRRKASLAYHDSLHKPLGVVEDVALDIAHEGRRTIYTIKFSPQAVSPFRLNAGESMRFAVLTNLCDGKTRYGSLETAPGILVKGKWPYGFQELVLVENLQ